MPATLAVFTLYPGRALAGDPGCQAGLANPQQAWAQGPQTINVDVDLSDPAAVTAVQQAFTNWQNSPAGQASQITFNVKQLPLGGTPTGQYLVDEAVLPPNKAAVTTTVPTPQVARTSATTTLNLDSGLDSNPDAVERILAHEIGHTFGLPDAYTNTITGLPCLPGTSVMNPLDASDLAASPTGPTAGDSDEVISDDGYGPPSGGGGGDQCSTDPTAPCECTSSGCISPVIIDVNGSGYQLTDAAHGVRFDFFGTGHRLQLAWTAPGSTNAFLVLPRNGRVDNGSELFGNLTPQPVSAHPNGFAALAVYDRPGHGGNGDGIIDPADAIYSRLRLWQDRDHDGKVQPGELRTLAESGITGISLDYHAVPGADRYGNRYGFAARVISSGHAAVVGYDFFLTTSPAGAASPSGNNLPILAWLAGAAAIAVLGAALAIGRRWSAHRRIDALQTIPQAEEASRKTPTPV